MKKIIPLALHTIIWALAVVHTPTVVKALIGSFILMMVSAIILFFILSRNSRINRNVTSETIYADNTLLCLFYMFFLSSLGFLPSVANLLGVWIWALVVVVFLLAVFANLYFFKMQNLPR